MNLGECGCDNDDVDVMKDERRVCVCARAKGAAKDGGGEAR